MDLARLLADPARLRVFSAVALGARTPDDIAEKAGLPPREVAGALRKLQAGELVTSDLTIADLREIDDTPTGPLHPFVQGERLASVPASATRRQVVLQHVVTHAFTPDRIYTEPEVNAALRVWCDGGEVDHVTIRRYLIDAGLLVRADGRYRVAPDHAEQPVL